MSTGIISLVAQQLHLERVANGLFYVNLVAYPVCGLLLLGRALLAFKPFWADLTSHAKGPLFLAFVPASCLVGNQFVQLRHNSTVGGTLWLVAAAGWLLLLYALLVGVSIAEEKPDLEKGLTGAWLLLVVATESLAVLGAKLVPSWAASAEMGLMGIASAFLLGAVLYFVLITLLFYRLTFVRLREEEVGAAYWISVGASAITVLAGAALVQAMEETRALLSLLPFVRGLCLLFWAVSTWWLPLVAILRAWNHWNTRPAFAYSAPYWSMVFPLGMYTAATFQLSEALSLPALKVVPTYFIYVALLVWGLTFAGMLLSFLHARKESTA
ncbi:tellurite resistance/C4-dicarboxylate transporter family protein [Hymenobacter terrigena]